VRTSAQATLAAGAERREEIVSTADMLREEGRLKGQRSTLLKQLAIRFGDLPEAAVRRVQEADAVLLDAWIERVVRAPTLSEVLGES